MCLVIVWSGTGKKLRMLSTAAESSTLDSTSVAVHEGHHTQDYTVLNVLSF